MAPTATASGEGSSETRAGAGGVTCTTASAVEPLRPAWIIVLPKASAVKDRVVESAPAGTVTLLGRLTIPVGLAVRATEVPEDCAAEIVTVSEPVAPMVTACVGGCSETTVGGAGVTVIVLVAVEPFSEAVTVAVPGELADTDTGALSWPAGTVTKAGTDTMPEALLSIDTVVALLCAALMVTVRAPLAPWVRVSWAGNRLLMVGVGAVTCTMPVACPAAVLTVICALPTATPCTGMATLVWPAA